MSEFLPFMPLSLAMMAYDFRMNLILFYLNDFTLISLRTLSEINKGNVGFVSIIVSVYINSIVLWAFFDIYEASRNIRNKREDLILPYKKNLKGFVEDGLDLDLAKGSFWSLNSNLNFFARYCMIYASITSLQVLSYFQISLALVVSMAYSVTTLSQITSLRAFGNWIDVFGIFSSEIILSTLLIILLIVKISGPSLTKSKVLIWFIILGLIFEFLHIIFKMVNCLVNLYRKKKKTKKGKKTKRKINIGRNESTRNNLTIKGRKLSINRNWLRSRRRVRANKNLVMRADKWKRMRKQKSRPLWPKR